MASVVYKNDIGFVTKRFAIRIIKFVNYLKIEKVDYPLRDQLLRCGTSIGANIREGKASSSRKEFIRYNEIALRSAYECEYWIELINEVHHYEQVTKELITTINEIISILNSIIRKLKATQ